MILGQCKNNGEFCGKAPYPPFEDHGKCCEGSTCQELLRTKKCRQESSNS